MKKHNLAQRAAALALAALLLGPAVPAHAGIRAVNETQLSSYRFESEEAYVNMIRPLARKVGLKYNYLPSVLAAQCILETGYGGYSDPATASMVCYNNHLGMKTHMINDTWETHTVWPGKSYIKRTPEWYGGTRTSILDSFRVYDSVEQCLIDYVMFMSWAKLESGAYKYRSDVIGNANFKRTIRRVRLNGYCTDPAYDRSVIRLIRKWNLTKLDSGFGIPVTRVRLNRTKNLVMPVGGTFYLKASVMPANARNTEIVWSSSDASVATVSSNGFIRAIGRGMAVVTAASRDNPSKKALIRIQVKR